jgi:Acyl-protein synthetase, LuxE
MNKHRMNQQLSSFAARLRESIERYKLISSEQELKEGFDSLALKLFVLQFTHNFVYRKICETRKLTPHVVEHWTQIPAVPTSAFKELELTSLAPDKCTAVFYSSGTTEQKPSRHFHNAESLAVYQASLWKWFQLNISRAGEAVFLTPNASAVPRSSLIHMFETVRQMFGLSEATFTGKLSAEGSWAVDFAATIQWLKIASETGKPLTLLGTAFSFVHLLDHLGENDLQFDLPKGSRVMETGGYKNHSRAMPKAELHVLITKQLGIPTDDIICEYGMSELSSQAYAVVRPSPVAAMFNIPAPPDCGERSGESPLLRPGRAHTGSSHYHFPPWARTQIISPETGREVAEGETGFIRVFDLANVFSVAAIQTEDLGIRRGDGFELIGRAQLAEPRGCSLMTV